MKSVKKKSAKSELEVLISIIEKHKRKLPKEMLEELKELEK